MQKISLAHMIYITLALPVYTTTETYPDKTQYALLSAVLELAHSWLFSEQKELEYTQ